MTTSAGGAQATWRSTRPRAPSRPAGCCSASAAGEIETVAVRPHVRGYLRTSFELDDKVTAAIRADEPAACMQRPAPAPATSLDPNGLVLRVLAAMSTDECVLIRLQEGSEHVGRIVRRTPDGLVLDTGTAIALAAVRVITAPPASRGQARPARPAAGCVRSCLCRAPGSDRTLD
jgi:hypothetical protein